MVKDQHNKNYIRPVFQITAIWAVFFFVVPLAGWKFGEVLRNKGFIVSIPVGLVEILFGLVIAAMMSGLCSALILHKKIPGFRLQHIILVTFGWGIAGFIASYIFYSLAQSILR